MSNIDFDSQSSISLNEMLKRFNISLSASKIRKLDEYCHHLWDWNVRLNLTRHTNYEKFVSRDLIDSLALSEFLRPKERVLDVGSGGGVPGVVLAILRPDLQIELCDSTGKKALALSEIVRELRLDLPVHHNKAEKILAERGKGTRFTSLTIRAVLRLLPLLQMVAPYWTVFDRLLLVKGPKWVEERGEARHYNELNNKSNKLALRCLKTYPNQISETETVDSVILQICSKDNLEQLNQIIDTHKTEEPDVKQELRRRGYKNRFKLKSKKE